jgi:hypothetical protein
MSFRLNRSQYRDVLRGDEVLVVELAIWTIVGVGTLLVAVIIIGRGEGMPKIEDEHDKKRLDFKHVHANRRRRPANVFDSSYPVWVKTAAGARQTRPGDMAKKEDWWKSRK